MSKPDDIREAVSRAYATAATAPPGACCGGPGPLDDRAVAALAGYDPQELEAVGPDAAAYSFGCGDPLALAGIEPGQTVVDLGCGAGLDLLLAARRVGPAGRVIGIDMTDEMLARARANIAAAGLGNVEVRKGLIEALPVETASVDWVISNCVINLSPQKRRVFAEIARVLRPGGRMLVSDIVVEDLPDWVRGDENLYNGCIGGAVSESDYLQGLRAAGLKDVGVVKRFVYDARQLQWMLGPGLHGRTCCGLGAGSAVDAGRVARDLAGRVWSAQFAAARA